MDVRHLLPLSRWHLGILEPRQKDVSLISAPTQTLPSIKEDSINHQRDAPLLGGFRK